MARTFGVEVIGGTRDTFSVSLLVWIANSRMLNLVLCSAAFVFFSHSETSYMAVAITSWKSSGWSSDHHSIRSLTFQSDLYFSVMAAFNKWMSAWLTLQDHYLPSIDHVRCVRMLVKHLHYFTNSLTPSVYHTVTTTTLDDIKRSVSPYSSHLHFLVHSRRQVSVIAGSTWKFVHWFTDGRYRRFFCDFLKKFQKRPLVA